MCRTVPGALGRSIEDRLQACRHSRASLIRIVQLHHVVDTAVHDDAFGVINSRHMPPSCMPTFAEHLSLQQTVHVAPIVAPLVGTVVDFRRGTRYLGWCVAASLVPCYKVFLGACPPSSRKVFNANGTETTNRLSLRRLIRCKRL